MKKLFVAAALLTASTGAYAFEPFHFGIALCEYSWSERTDSLLVGSKMNPNFPEDVLKRQEEYCSSKDNVRAAVEAHNKYLKSMQEQRESEERAQRWAASPEGRRAQAAKNAVTAEATDTYQACVLGASDDGKGYVKLVSSYGGNARMQLTLRKAHSYGYNVARTYRDCTNYVMGY